MLQAEELRPDFHREVYENARAEYGPDAEETGGAHGTTVERVPGLTTLIESPTVAGALQSLLGGGREVTRRTAKSRSQRTWRRRRRRGVKESSLQ